MKDVTMVPLYILKHFDTDIDNFKIFTNVDSALNQLRQWLKDDDNLMCYALNKYELDTEKEEFISTHEFELDELIEVDNSCDDGEDGHHKEQSLDDDDDDSSSGSLSFIDSDPESSDDDDNDG